MIPLLAGLGVLAALDQYDKWGQRRDGRRAGDTLDALGPSATQDQQASALMRAGLLSPRDMISAQQTQQQFGADQSWRQQQFGLEQQRMAMQQAQYDRQYSLDYMRQMPSPDGPINMDLAFDALVGMESGGNPNAVSPKGASGVGQIMPANIVPWAHEMDMAGNMSDAEIRQRYASDPAFQTELAKRKFGQYVQNYGLADAYSMWHSGRPLAEAVRAGAHDGNMSTPEYVARNMNRYSATNQRWMAQNQAEQDANMVATYGTAEQQAAYNNPALPADVRTGIAGEVKKGVVAAQTTAPAYDPMQDPTYLRGRAERTEKLRGTTMQQIDLLQGMEESVAYAIGTSAAGRAFNPEEAAAMASQWEYSGKQYLRIAMEAGALQQGDLEFMDSIMGAPNGWRNLTDREKARAVTILNTAKQSVSTTLRTNPDLAPDSGSPFALPLSPDQMQAVTAPMALPKDAGTVPVTSDMDLQPVPRESGKGGRVDPKTGKRY